MSEQPYMSDCPDSEIPIYHDVDGNERRLGLLPPTEEEKPLLKASLLPRVPSSDWRYYSLAEITSLVEAYISVWWLNQRSHGSCFPAGTLVRMADGTEKPIENIRPLENVVTAEGRVGRVLNVMVRDEKEYLTTIYLCGHKHLKCTQEHPILTKRGYVSAAKLRIGDCVALPRYMATEKQTVYTPSHVRPTRWMLRGKREQSFNGGPSRTNAFIATVTEVPDVLKLTPSAGRIFGLFLAEGSTDKTRVVWTFHENEENTFVDELVRLLKDEWGIDARKQYRKANKAVTVVVYGILWAQLFESLCRSGASEKSLHSDLLSGPRDFQESLLQGWLDGDGYSRRTTTQGTTVSHSLALEMYDIAQALGRRPTIRLSHPKISHGVKHRKPRWDIEWGNTDRGDMDETHVWRKVQGTLLTPFSGHVYNLHVEGDESYVAEGIGVHNCVGFSAAGAEQSDRILAGEPPPSKLSGSYIYSWINGNRDNGASIIAAQRVLELHGTCFETTVPWNVIYRRNISQAADIEAQRFRLEPDSSGTLGDFQEVVECGQAGKPVQFGTNVGRNYENFDNDGVPGYSGPGANHSIYGWPWLLYRTTSGRVLFPWFQSWGPTWGPFRKSWAFIDSRHVNGGGGGFVHGTIRFDPQNPNPLPKIKK